MKLCLLQSQRRCWYLTWYCNVLVNALREDNPETVPTNTDAWSEAQQSVTSTRVVDHLELQVDWCRILQSVHEKVDEWANLNKMKTLLRQGEISGDIDRLHKEIDKCMRTYNVLFLSIRTCSCPHFLNPSFQVRTSQELDQGRREQTGIAECDRTELQDIMENLLERFFPYTSEDRASEPHSPLCGTTVDEIVHNIEEVGLSEGPNTLSHFE